LSDELSAQIELIDPQPGLPDMVFTANAGVVFENKFVVSNFRHEARREEAAHFARWFRARGFEVVQLPPEYHFEGEGDLLRCGEFWFAGYHIRSDMLAHQKVAAITGREILSLELTSGWYYHLDTCFCPLSEQTALFYPPAFDEYARAVLASHIPDLIPVSASEAERFACNAVVNANQIVMNTGCPVIAEKLEERGFHVYVTPMDEFLKAGGSAKCLTLVIG
jgi:N-dimethylarginine dimethylaminohydrolase